MSESTQFTFTHKEIAETLVKRQGIHEGLWGIFIKFGIKGMNVGSSDADLLPAAIVPVVEIGLQRFEAENNLCVDASKVNPVSTSPLGQSGRSRGTRGKRR